MKNRDQQFEQEMRDSFADLKTSIVESVGGMIRESHEKLSEKIDTKIDELAMSTAKGFDGVNARIDGTEAGIESLNTRLNGTNGLLANLAERFDAFAEDLDEFKKDTAFEFKLVHQEINTLRFDTEKRFEQVDANIRLRRLILE